MRKAIHQGTLDINGINITCAVLDDGTRVISERSLALALGIRGGGAYWEKRKELGSGQVLPEYIAVNNIEPFVSEALKVKLTESISYLPKSGKVKGKSAATGFRAEILPEICDAWIKANEARALTKSQQVVAKTAYTILKGFATVGIIALVDEATGYQYDRERDELQKILKAYISEELLAWQKRFPDEFYKEIFRLNNWDYTVDGIMKYQQQNTLLNWKEYLKIKSFGVQTTLLSIYIKAQKGGWYGIKGKKD